MDERTKHLITIIGMVLLLGVEAYFIVAQTLEVRKLDRDNKRLVTEITTLENTKAKRIPKAEKEPSVRR